MSRLEELQKAFDSAETDYYVAGGRVAFNAANDAALAAWVAFYNAKQELKDYKKESGL